MPRVAAALHATHACPCPAVTSPCPALLLQDELLNSMLEEEPAANKLALCTLAAAAISGGAAGETSCGVRGCAKCAWHEEACIVLPCVN